MTFQQLRKKPRSGKQRKTKVPALQGCPFKIGIVKKVFIEKPKKPNSARRKVVKVELSNKRLITCHIPGIGHSLSKFNQLFIRGGRTKDLIGVRYKAVRCKLDLPAVKGRLTRKTKFGINPLGEKGISGTDTGTSIDMDSINYNENS